MILQGFNAVTKTIEEIIEFCERLETSKDIFDSTHIKSQKGKTKSGHSQDPDSKLNAGRKNTGQKQKSRDAPYNCLYHGKNFTHNTNQCKVMHSQAQHMASAHQNMGGKYQCKKGNKDQHKKQYKSFLSDLAQHINKKRKLSKESDAKEHSFNMESFNYEQFCELQVSNSSDFDKSSANCT